VRPRDPSNFLASFCPSSRLLPKMGCKSSKGASAPQPAANKASADGTLLPTPNSGKVASETVVQHRMMRIPIKPDALGAMLAIAQGAEMRAALNQLKGMMDLEITKVPDEDVIFTHSRWEDEASMKAAEAKIGELLKPMGAHFAGAPQRFYATGGAVQLSGESVWTFVPNVAAAATEEAPAAAQQEVEEVQNKPVEEEQEPVFKLTGADDEQEVPVDADQACKESLEKEKRTAAAPGSSWLFGSCCVANP